MARSYPIVMASFILGCCIGLLPALTRVYPDQAYLDLPLRVNFLGNLFCQDCFGTAVVIFSALSCGLIMLVPGFFIAAKYSDASNAAYLKKRGL